MNRIIDMLSQKSWKTSFFGTAGAICALVAASGLVEDPHTQSQVSKLSELLLGIGLYFARDNNKTSEDIGLK
jgi:hypothetical protein